MGGREFRKPKRKKKPSEAQPLVPSPPTAESSPKPPITSDPYGTVKTYKVGDNYVSESEMRKSTDKYSNFPLLKRIGAGANAFASGSGIATIWRHINRVLGWDGFSFAFLFTLAMGLLAMEEFAMAKVAFSVSALVLGMKLVLSSRQYLLGAWRWIGTILGVVFAVVFMYGMLTWVHRREVIVAGRDAAIAQQRARLSFENVHFVRETTRNKLPLRATVPGGIMQSDGTTVIPLPVGFPFQPAMAQVSVRNIGKLYALDVNCSGGLVVSDLLDAQGEDRLYERMKGIPFAAQEDLKDNELENLNLKTDHILSSEESQALISEKKFLYIVLVASFRDKLGGPLTAEFCGRYKSSHLEMKLSCTKHNQ
jgi:hypothetical protein